ncbi:hypothetical protein FH972_024221 [Carpinus fangiana]|uniref:Uncharacterized protein n=1 Tax=Carpinus fangiana TaxID=176857 RepID=A0A5N6KXE7_9ROSI|nr:hypothetical protein FH972_024221 [Carpinus fangiana]
MEPRAKRWAQGCSNETTDMGCIERRAPAAPNAAVIPLVGASRIASGAGLVRHRASQVPPPGRSHDAISR